MKSITFNLLTGAIGEVGDGKKAAQFDDDQLKGKTLQIGHGKHATVLVVKDDGSKTYYDNQNGIEQVQTTVKEFLKNKGFDGEETKITIE